MNLYARIYLAFKNQKVLIPDEKYLVCVNEVGVYSIWMRIGVKFIDVGHFLTLSRAKMAKRVILGGMSEC